ncbi:hypothetical protein NQ314_015764 [Rhamnusium bicolor]|uniref:DDE-1 domain-containing protein n=1 Tax=Rhamnusium bicolor TaxID=1586634 RepID=A0AAV8WYZ4_9CUCU|nr:hypothetical protein NQ314_015764 [Rhamnusium bicolor]
MPGRDFALGFLSRHKKQLAVRLCQNIKRSRAAVSSKTINDYFDNLTETLKDIPPSNIINYDETNLNNDPLCCLQSETSLSTWIQGGPSKTRYNVTTSGWFDIITFTDWVKTIAVPYLKNLPGQKVLIGDNLTTHLSPEAITLCQQYNIRFAFLPSNSTHLTEPLNIAFFRPMKGAWRKILTNWRQGSGMKEPSIPKDVFPRLLNKLWSALQENLKKMYQLWIS